MKEVEVVARRLRRVARVFYSHSQTGLQSKAGIRDIYAYIFYDPVTKLYFAGSFRNVYVYVYSNQFQSMVDFVLKEMAPLFLTPDSFIAQFNNDVFTLATKGPVPVKVIRSGFKTDAQYTSWIQNHSPWMEKRSDHFVFKFAYPGLNLSVEGI